MDACIDHAIFQLLDAGILSAVSCMSGGASFARHVAQLKASDTDIGLHLNLSEPLSAADRDMLPLCALLVRAYAGRLDPQRISQAIERQLDAFEDEMGQAPHYIDGHQHVHQLPGVRGPLLQALQRRCRDCHGLPWPRRMSLPAWAGMRWQGNCASKAGRPMAASSGPTALRAASATMQRCCITGLPMRSMGI
nr:ChbG/HpnK family deacetylase [Bordetella holmesii]